MKSKKIAMILLLVFILAGCSAGVKSTPEPTPTPTAIPKTPPVSIAPTVLPSGEGPAIVVNTPSIGQKISSPFTIQGSAKVFEASVSYRLRDKNNNVLAKGSVMASAGAPERGNYSVSVSFTPSDAGNGWVEVFEVSAKDGSEINKIIVPVKW